MIRKSQFTASPACFPTLELEAVLRIFQQLGFENFEPFVDWAKSALDWREGTASYRELGEKYGLRYTSMHLPAVQMDKADSLNASVQAAIFADQLGAEVVIFKAKTVDDYLRSAVEFLDRTAHLNVIPVITNHRGTAISTLEDYVQVMDGIKDHRMKALLEVGHFHLSGVSWQAAYSYLREKVALVHIKDLKNGECVEFGTGEVDIKGLFTQLHQDRYSGKIVIEVEGYSEEVTKQHLAKALMYFQSIT